jgi:pimeloyl-ACP methyl ester carboxylesterase
MITMRTAFQVVAAFAATVPGVTHAQPTATPAPEVPINAELSRYADPPLVRLGDGRRINISCAGEGAPTVILTPGLGGSAAGWHAVLKEVSATTRVCAWSQAGHGGSDASSRPQDSIAAAEDLEATLHAARITGPLVLVAHSMGSFSNLIFADRQPGRVVAMVLVEPSAPDQNRRFAEAYPDFQAREDAQTGRELAAQRTCIAAMPTFPGLDEAAVTQCLGRFDPSWPQELVTAERARRSDPQIAATRLSARENFLTGLNSRQAANPRRNYGAMPLIVLTREKSGIPPQVPPADHEFAQRYLDLWPAMHAELAALSTRGEQRIIAGADHRIPFRKPEVVVQAVHDAMRMVSARR